jgi:hypothetical protein
MKVVMCEGCGGLIDEYVLPDHQARCRGFRDGVKTDRVRDDVNHPEHYTSGGIECIDAIRAALTPEEFRGFLKGNIIKYTWRERMKGGVESLKKASWYLRKLTEM